MTGELLERAAQRWPDRLLLRFDGGEQFTAVELLHAVRSRAAALQALGVQQGDHVLGWLPNGPAAVLTWLAVNLLGAVHVPINTAYRGRLLERVINGSGAALMVADGPLLDRLANIPLVALRRIVAIGEPSVLPPGCEVLSSDSLRAPPDDFRPPERAVAPWDTQCVIYTSGTTGASKGVLCSYRHTHAAASGFRHVGPGDTNLVALPLFHIGGVLGVNFALIHGGTAVVVERFRTQTFWQTVRAFDVTATGLLGTMVQFLLQQPAEPGEREHPLRSVVIAPFGDEAPAFAQRFGVRIHTLFNMTELSVPLWAGPDTVLRGACGRPMPGTTLRLVDAHDQPVPVGAVGELVVRPDEPWTISHGYLNEPEATARSWRNGWFHTGDLFRRDAQDNYFFVDRAKDMIRRRGENISSFEVEAELLAFPGVVAAAAVPVPGDGGEDDVLAVICAQPDVPLDPAALIAFLQPRLADFMMPRYVRCVAAMPLTPSQKIEKHVLRAEGITDDTWDRLGSRPAVAASSPATPPPAATAGGALAGLRVLEFSGLGPAPFCAMLLADLGADVLCIDRPGTHHHASDVEARGRSRVQLDLKEPAQQQHALQLLARADILIEGFRPGVMERLGLGPEVALARNPRLVYGRMTGWGQHGPLSGSAGHDLNYLAITGALHAVGTADRPAIPLNLVADFGGGALYLALGVLAALHHARGTGKGQVVDAAMTDGVISLMSMVFGDFADGRWIDARESNVIDGGAPFYNVYRCADHRWLSVAAIEPAFHRILWETLVADGAVDAASAATRMAGQWQREDWPAGKALLARIFSQRPRDAWCALFQGRDACVAPVLSLAEAQVHPHNVARGTFTRVGDILQPAAAPRLSATPARPGLPPGASSLTAEEALRRWS